MKPDLTNIDAERNEWGSVVGKLILIFGDIENVTYMALYQLPSDQIFNTTSKLCFSRRIDLVIELIEAHPEINEDLSEQFKAKLKVARK